jgi:oligopeptide transport system substrate-binding protein
VHARAIDALSTEGDTTALNLYLTGAVDWLPSAYPLDLVDELRRRPDFYSNPALVVYFYRFNTTKPPFNDRRVREALNLAVDRKLIAEQVLGLGQPPATTFVPPVAGYRPPDSGISLDVARARKLLAEAGYPDGRGFPEVGILYNTNQSHKKIAEVVADQLRKNLGIGISAYNQEWQSFLDTVRKLDYAMARASWVGDYADPNTFLDMFVTNGGNNETGFSSDVYDALIAAAADVGTFAEHPEALLARAKYPEDLKPAIATSKAAPEPAERLRAQAELRMMLFREAEAVLVRDEFPILPLYFYVVSGLVAPNVRGFYSTLHFDDGTTGPNLQDLHPLRDLWVDASASKKGSP